MVLLQLWIRTWARTLKMGIAFTLPWLLLSLLVTIEFSPSPQHLRFLVYGSFILGFLGLWIGGQISPALLIRLFQGEDTIPEGLQKTLEYTLKNNNEFLKPQLVLFPSPIPEMLVAKNFTGHQTILLSHGTLSLFSENELRSLLLLATRKLKEPALTLRTLASLCAYLFLKLMPVQWSELIFETTRWNKNHKPTGAFSALFFLILYPYVIFFIRRSTPIHHSSSTNSRAYGGALEKLIWNHDLNQSKEKYCTQALQLTWL